MPYMNVKISAARAIVGYIQVESMYVGISHNTAVLTIHDYYNRFQSNFIFQMFKNIFYMQITDVIRCALSPGLRLQISL